MANNGTNSKLPVGIPPEIIEQPEDIFVVRNRPATLTCKALHAERISFKCNGDWVRPVHHTNSAGIDPKSAYPYLQSSIPIHRKEVEAYFGLNGFQCECFAWAPTGGTAKSNLATVRTSCKCFLEILFYYWVLVGHARGRFKSWGVHCMGLNIGLNTHRPEFSCRHFTFGENYATAYKFLHGYAMQEKLCNRIQTA